MLPKTMFTYSIRAIAVATLFGGVFVLPATAQMSKAPGSSSSRQWPSQLLPPHPIEIRICSCLYAGQDIPVGKTICMERYGKRVKATCGRVVNNPSWEISSDPCPSS